MGYVLYGAPGFGSMAAEAALEELGADYQFVEAERDAAGAFSAAYMAINPRGQMPALRLPDGSVMTETAAILTHLADAFPEACMAPAPGTPARAQHDRWLSFLQVNVYEGILRSGYPDRYTADPATAPAVQAAAKDYVQRHLQLFDAAIIGPYSLGDRLSMLDLYVWMFAQWVDQEPLAARCPNLTALRALLATRPALATVSAHNPV